MTDSVSRTRRTSPGRRKTDGMPVGPSAAADSILIAELGQRALTQTDLASVMSDAVSLVSQRLNTEYVKILELVPSGEGFLLTAGVGWRPGYVGQVVVPLQADSHAGYTLQAGAPIIVEDLHTETRFGGDALLHEHGIVSGIAAVLRGRERAYGVLAAHTAERRKFSADEVAFLESAAGIVAAAMDRREIEEALRESNEHLHLAMDAGRMGTWEWNPHTGAVIWSETLENIHGFDPGTFPGTSQALFALIHPDDRDRVQLTIARSLQEGEHEMEYRALLRDGSVRWLSARGVVIRDARGEPARMIGVCMDITERKQAEAAERAARAEAEAAVNRQSFLAEASAILSSSLDFEETLASLASLCVPFLADWCTVDVLDGSELRRVAVVHADPAKVEFAKQLQERYPPDPNSPELRQVLTGESVRVAEITEELMQYFAQDGEHREIIRNLGLRSVIGVALKASGRTLGLLTLVTAESGRIYTTADVALAEEVGQRAGLAVENAMLYRVSQEVQEELRRANEAKDEFLGLVSHELRTPITTIYGGAHLLRTRGATIDEESRISVLEDIEHEAERLHRIVEDLLVLARLELGEEIATEPVLLQRMVEKSVNAFKKRRPGREFVVQLDDAMAPVRASNVSLEQILRNLMNNADKYSPPDTVIEIISYIQDGDAVTSVMDRGPGIPPEEVDLIFERFYRSQGTAKQAGGAGIGLTVCKRLVEAQHGRIWADPRDGGGLIVSFSLPRYEDRTE
jgi:PAS domain S-box-containing protein